MYRTEKKARTCFWELLFRSSRVSSSRSRPFFYALFFQIGFLSSWWLNRLVLTKQTTRLDEAKCPSLWNEISSFFGLQVSLSSIFFPLYSFKSIKKLKNNRLEPDFFEHIFTNSRVSSSSRYSFKLIGKYTN